MSTQNPHSLRIFTIISQIEQLLESAPKPKLGAGGRRLVDVDEIYDLLGDLKVTIPEDIRRANSVLIEADTLLDHANQDAVEIVDQANQEANSLREQARVELMETRKAAEQEFEARVAEDSVYAEVQKRCAILQRHAEENANLVYDGAKEYADAILQDVQRYLMEYHHMVGKNRDELGVAAAAQPRQQAKPIIGGHPNPPVQAPGAAQRAAQDMQEPMDEQEQQDDEAPQQKRSWFRKGGGKFFEDDADEDNDDEFEIEDQKKPRKRGRRHSAELDIDLDE
ncbi:hypothetical protein LJC27_05605 [Christensenellaceae bacterium OttesenSCG-928-M15]|nr:hypothetical protein [Christensenellaceae bacterium OttesenSCG-928-M15]